jgi:transposase
MANVQAILALYSQGWSQRRIARELQLDRASVSRHVREQGLCETAGENSKPANAPISGPGSAEAKAADASSFGSSGENSKPANAPISGPGETGAGRDSAVGRFGSCAAWREVIETKQATGLTARRIYQDLVSEHGAKVSYDSVRRYLKKVGWTRPLPFRRMECLPGQEAQVDFGTAAPVVGPDGKRRRAHVFRIVLSHSRKGYSEATYRQTTDDFLGALENAFEHFGGVPQTLVIDNLKAAVKHPDWFDPELVPRVAAFAAHYGVAILPTKPYTPRHKGKVERGIDYVQENGLAGRRFASLAEQNQHLKEWEAGVADTRIHGTTRQHVGRVFREVERPALRPLPGDRFSNFREGQRSVNRDGHVEVAKAYYSAPPEYLGRRVWVRWDARTVRIFNHRWEQVALHARREPGRFSTIGEHLAGEKINGIERGTAWLLSKASAIGPQAVNWAESMLESRGICGVRVLQGLLSLATRHPPSQVDRACEVALGYRAFHLRSIRQLIRRDASRQQPLEFLDQHPIIRPLEDYGQWLRTALAAPQGRNQRDPQVPSPDPILLPLFSVPQ